MVKITDNEIEKTEQMVNMVLNENTGTSLTEEQRKFFEVTIDDINSSLNGIETSDDVMAKKVSKLKSSTKKSITQLADDVVSTYMADRSDKNWKNLQEFFWFGIKQFSYKYTQNWDDAYDMTIETFIRALEKIDSYDPEKARFSTWLWTICRNNCIRFLKQKTRIPTINNDISEIYDSEFTEDTYTIDVDSIEISINNDGNVNESNLDPSEELYEVAIEEINRMKDVGGTILKMKLVDNLKIREIAKKLDMHESTVKNHLYKSKENLSRIIRINHKELYTSYIESGADRNFI